MNKFDRLRPEEAFEEAATLLSRTNPRNAWSLCAEKKLGNLLEEYIFEAMANRPDTPIADEFGGSIGLESTFAVSFFQQAIASSEMAPG